MFLQEDVPKCIDRLYLYDIVIENRKRVIKVDKKEFLTPRERTLRAFNFERGDRVAANMGVPEQYAARFEEKYGPDYAGRFNHHVMAGCMPVLAWPTAPGIWVDDDGIDKVWWYTEPLFKDYDEAAKLELPDPRNPHVFDNLYKSLKEEPDNAKALCVWGPFTHLHNMRLMDNIYTDIYDDPDGMHRIIKRIMDIQNDMIRQAVELPFDVIYYMDDIAASRSLLMSRDTICEFILDYFEEGAAITKKAGKKLAFHSDGNVTDILDDLYRIGFDAINPMQPQFNDFGDFMRKFDGKMIVLGGIDNTEIVPLGTPEEIRAHVEDVFGTLGKNGGLIMATHQIRNVTSFENWEALLGAIYDCWY